MKQAISISMLANVLLFLLITSVTGQDLVNFTLVDHFSVGLTATPYEKWGQAIADIDNNGWPDIFCRRWAGPFNSRIYLNFEGMFQDITDQTPLENIERNETHTRTVSLVDYDNDGDKDIFWGTDNRMYFLRNDNNVFTEISESIGLISQKPPGFITRWDYNIGAWVDIDLDGDLDVMVCQSNNPNFYLYRNDNGIFTDVASEYGFKAVVPLGTDGDRGNNSARIHWIDYDMDGDLDLSTGQFLFRNENGKYKEIADSIGLTPSLPIQNSDWFDYDNDGDLDFMKTCNYSETQGCSMELWENQDGLFSDVSYTINTLNLINLSRGMAIGDFDNDGDQDFFLNHNQDEELDALMLNEEIEPGVRVFEKVTQDVGITALGDRKGGAFFDYDKDGFLDLYIPHAHDNHHLYHNDRNDNNWVGFILEGTQSNRDAIGTVVKLYTGSGIQVRYMKCPDEWLRQNNPWIHFGLGQNTNIDSVVIRWPLGLIEVLSNVTINQYHTIKEGEAISSVYSHPDFDVPNEYRLEQNYPNPFNPQTTILYTIPKGGDVQITIYDLSGKFIRSYFHSHNSGGHFKIVWDGRDNNNKLVSSGLYVYKMNATTFMTTKKMLFLK